MRRDSVSAYSSLMSVSSPCRHSVWSTIASEVHAAEAGLWIAGYEMLKGLAGVATHEHREWVPILENDQDMPRLAFGVGDVLTRWPDAHGFLLRQHGLYTWGATLDEATRHVEILEFLLEATTRAREIAGAQTREARRWPS